MLAQPRRRLRSDSPNTRQRLGAAVRLCLSPLDDALRRSRADFGQHPQVFFRRPVDVQLLGTHRQHRASDGAQRGTIGVSLARKNRLWTRNQLGVIKARQPLDATRLDDGNDGRTGKPPRGGRLSMHDRANQHAESADG